MSKIEWTDVTWNPITGCSKVSEGCVNCYAERMAKRLGGRFGYPKDNPFSVTFHKDRLQEIDKVTNKDIFVCSMGDLFHEDVKNEWLVDVFAEMLTCAFFEKHRFFILTKRPERMAAFFESIRIGNEKRIKPMLPLPFPYIALGVSVENQEQADKRIPILLQIPAHQRFVSIEPMLCHIDISRYLVCESCIDPVACWCADPRINWVICGGETGPKARPMHPEWVRSLLDQCTEAEVPFFFKQWGEYGTKAYLSTTGKSQYVYYQNKIQWINKPQWINGGLCLDMSGKIMEKGADFDTAKYPISILHKIGKERAGNKIDGQIYQERLPQYP